MLAAIAIAALIGAGVNGVLIGRVGLSFFVVTLGTLSLYQGIVSLWSHTQTHVRHVVVHRQHRVRRVPRHPDADLDHGRRPTWSRSSSCAGPTSGRDVYAVGGNIEAARLSGINVAQDADDRLRHRRARAPASPAVIQVGRLGAASPMVGADIPLNAAAAVLLGGTSFLGGVGGVSGTAVGVLFIGTLQNGLAIAGVQSFWQQVVTGVILIVAIAIDRVQQQGSNLWPRKEMAAAPTDGPPAPGAAGASGA